MSEVEGKAIAHEVEHFVAILDVAGRRHHAAGTLSSFAGETLARWDAIAESAKACSGCRRGMA